VRVTRNGRAVGAADVLLAKAREYELMAASFADAASLSDENAPSAIGFTIAAIVLREVAEALEEAA
jgi:hypothetical protein